MANKESTWSPPEPAPLSVGKGSVELGEIVVFTDGSAETAGILEFAGMLAQEHDARLLSVFIQPQPIVTPPQTFARGKGLQSTIEVHRAQLERIEAQHHAQVAHSHRRHGTTPEQERSRSP